MEIILNQNIYPIGDLHCDLLCYLSRSPDRSPYDGAVRCSIPQLKQGNVKLQIMAIFTETSETSVPSGLAQVEAFKGLIKHHSEVFELVRQPEQLESLMAADKIGIMAAIENASSFCDENEKIESGLHRLNIIQHKLGSIAYVSLTWNTENRFGGGALTKVGLKDDGKKVINHLSEKGIALDFSHASDYLAYEALTYIDKNQLPVRLLASHSNFRSVANVPRNLPDDLAKEILQRNGLIGLNFVRPFVGVDSPNNFVKQIEHAVKLGRPQGICFGADFFFTDDVSPTHRKSAEELFFPSFDHSGSYSRVLDMWRRECSFSKEFLHDICFGNLAGYLSQSLM